MSQKNDGRKCVAISSETAIETVYPTVARPHAVAFVDYEHWMISLDKLYHMKPNIDSWIEDVHTRVKLRDIYFFGDFSAPEMENELYRIRSCTNKAIETRNAGYYRKDFTDFIMLDSIYQQVILSPETESFILFSGDAHFNSAAAFLKNICRKEVGVYGVRGALSNQLKKTSSWWVEVPNEVEEFRRYYTMLFQNIRHLEQIKNRTVFPTFMRTVENTAEYNQVDRELIRAALQQLIEKGYIGQRTEYVAFHKTITALSVDWDMAEMNGLWSPQEDTHLLCTADTGTVVPSATV